MKPRGYRAIIAVLVLVVAYFALKAPKTIVEHTDKLSICKAQSEARLEAIGTFCTMIQDQHTPENCLKLDYVKEIGSKTGNQWIGECAGTWLGDTRPEAGDGSASFETHRSPDPLNHR